MPLDAFEGVEPGDTGNVVNSGTSKLQRSLKQ